MTFVVNDAHILVLERSTSAKNDFGSRSAAGLLQRKNGRYAGYDTGLGYSLITAAEYASKPDRFKAQHYGFRRAVVGVEKVLPVDPYVLGLWLGDGSSKAPEITNVDPEIIGFIYRVADENGWSVTKIETSNKTPRYYVGSNYQRRGSLIGQLRNADVLNNKHIPECYFGASVGQRRALLSGIVDTDGHVSNGCIEISQSRESLLDDIVRLAHGLGLKASKRKSQVPCNGRICDAWSTQIGGDIDKLPLLIPRKRDGARVRKNKDWRRTRVDVAPIGVGEYFGFELDGDHLFLLADGTVTHNTRSFAKMAAVRGYIYGKQGISGQILCARQYMNSLEDSSLEECKRAIEDEPFLAAYYDCGEKYIKSRDGRIWFGFAGLDKNIASIKSKGRILLCWVDEAEPVTESAWQTLEPTLREEGEDWHAELWVTWNPKRKHAPVEKRYRERDSDPLIKVAELNWQDNPMFPDKLERQRLRDLNERPDAYGHIWDGDYETVISGAYFADLIRDARRQGRIGRVPTDPLMTIRLFADIGGTGARADAFVFWAVQFIGLEIRVINYYERQGQPIGEHLGWLRDQKYTPNRAQIWLPHDGRTNDRIYDVSYESAFRDAGYTVTTVPNQGTGAATARIEAARRRLPLCWFNESTCKPGLDALEAYHEKWDETRNIGLGPDHDWSSHGSDAYGLMSICYEQPKPVDDSIRNRPAQNWRVA